MILRTQTTKKSKLQIDMVDKLNFLELKKNNINLFQNIYFITIIDFL